MNLKPSSPVWLFDLDNTLHNASHAIFPAITANMNAYIARVLGGDRAPAGAVEVNAARALGMRTAWVTQYLKCADPIGMAHVPGRIFKPAWVDVKVQSVRHLPARLARLR